MARRVGAFAVVLACGIATAARAQNIPVPTLPAGTRVRVIEWRNFRHVPTTGSLILATRDSVIVNPCNGCELAHIGWGSVDYFQQSLGEHRTAQRVGRIMTVAGLVGGLTVGVLEVRKANCHGPAGIACVILPVFVMATTVGGAIPGVVVTIASRERWRSLPIPRPLD